MSTTHCFLCLTDEGIFLNITSINYDSLRGDIETFLSLKVEQNSNDNKVCYKCAFELKQCSDFLKKYKKSCNVKNQKKNACSFCLETENKGYVFRLSRSPKAVNYPSDNLISNFQKHFQVDFFRKKTGTMLICLTCRYSLDILFDLKSLYIELSEARSTFDSNLDISTIPKVNTIIIKRKTTVPAYVKTKSYILNNTYTDSNNKKEEENSAIELNKDEPQQLKFRICSSCKNKIKIDEDMYRFYKTGLTVCKACWINMDPSKTNKRKRKIQSDTKLCAVFLKDVLSDTVAKKDLKGYKVEKDIYGNNIYIITDSESETETEIEKAHKSDSDTQDKSKKINIKSNKGQKRSQLNLLHDSSDSENKSSNKKIKIDTEKETTVKITKVLDRKYKTRSSKTSHYSDTDILSIDTAQISKTQKSKKSNEKEVYSLSDSGIRKSQRNKRKQTMDIIEENNTSSEDSLLFKNNMEKKKSNEQSISEQSKSQTDNNIIIEKNKKIKLDSTSSTSINEDASLLTKKNVMLTSVKTIDLDEKINSNEKKNSSKKKDLSNRKETYNCRECGITFKNKLQVITHELTHSKTLELKLNKVMIQNKNKEIKEETDEFNDELSEQQNEEITLSVNDDEELETVDDVLDQQHVTEDTVEKVDKEKMNLSLTENKVKDSSEIHGGTEKKDLKESKLTKTIEESNSKESNLKLNKDDKKESPPKCVIESDVLLTSMENNNTSKDDKDKDKDNDKPIQNDDDGSDNDSIKNAKELEEKTKEMNKETKDKDEKEVKENNAKNSKSNIDQSENDNIKEKTKEKTMEVDEELEDKEQEEENKKQSESKEHLEDEDQEKDEEQEENEKQSENKEQLECKEQEENEKQSEDKEQDQDKEQDHDQEQKQEKDKEQEGVKEMTEEDENVVVKDKEYNAKEIENVTNEQDDNRINEKLEDETNKSDEKEKRKEIDIITKSEDKSKEIRKRSIIEKEKQNSNVNEDNSVLSDGDRLDDIHGEKLKQHEEEKSIKDRKNDKNDKNETNKDEKNEINKEVVDSVSLETFTECNVSKSDVKSIKDDSDSVEVVKQQVEKQVDTFKTTMMESEKNKVHSNDAQRLLYDLTSLNEYNSSNEVDQIKEDNRESVSTMVEMEKRVSNLAMSEQHNTLSAVSNIRDVQLEAETLEDITLEIQKSADMPSLDPMNTTEIF